MTNLDLKHELFVVNQNGLLSDEAYDRLCTMIDTHYSYSFRYRHLTDHEKSGLRYLTEKFGNVWNLRFGRSVEYTNSERGKYKLIDEYGEVYLYTDKYKDVIMFGRTL